MVRFSWPNAVWLCEFRKLTFPWLYEEVNDLWHWIARTFRWTRKSEFNFRCFHHCHSVYKWVQETSFASLLIVRISVLLFPALARAVTHQQVPKIQDFFLAFCQASPGRPGQGGQRFWWAQTAVPWWSVLILAKLEAKQLECIMQAIREFACLLTIWMNQIILFEQLVTWACVLQPVSYLLSTFWSVWIHPWQDYKRTAWTLGELSTRHASDHRIQCYRVFYLTLKQQDILANQPFAKQYHVDSKPLQLAAIRGPILQGPFTAAVWQSTRSVGLCRASQLRCGVHS